MLSDKTREIVNALNSKTNLGVNISQDLRNPLSALPQINPHLLHKSPTNWAAVKRDLAALVPDTLQFAPCPQVPQFEIPSFEYSPRQIKDNVNVLGSDRSQALKFIEEHHLTPCHTTKVGDTQFTFSDMFLLDDKRLATVALVESPQGDSLRVYYKSNSSGTFRLLPAINLFSPYVPIYDKLFGEENLALNSTVQGLLSKLCKAPPCANFSDQEITALVPYNRSFSDWNYFRDKTLFNPHKHSQAEKIVQENCQPNWNLRVAPGFEPDFKTLVREFEISDYFATTVSAYVYHSTNGQIEYVVAKEQESNRIWFAMIGSAEDKLDNSGLPERKFNAGHLLVPLYEYPQILPKGTYPLPGPEGNDKYCCAWNFIQHIPYIRQWYHAQGMPIPK